MILPSHFVCIPVTIEADILFLHELLSCHSFSHIYLQTFPNHFLSVLRHHLRHPILPLLYFPKQFSLRTASERELPCDQRVQQHTYCPHVDSEPAVLWLLVQQFRRHVIRCPTVQPQLLCPWLDWKPKIDKTDWFGPGVVENIVQFQISVRYFLCCVQVVHSLGQLTKNGLDYFRAYLASFLGKLVVFQSKPLDVVRHDVSLSLCEMFFIP